MAAIHKQYTEQAGSNTQQNCVGIVVLSLRREINNCRIIFSSYSARVAKNAATKSALV